MLPRSRVREIGRSAVRTSWGRLPGPVRARLLGAVGPRAGLTGAEIGLVSVVMVPEEGDRIEGCVSSIRGQNHALLDVVVSPVGRAAVELPPDRRFRSVAPAATAYDAVRRGIAAASGRYVVLVRGCDQLLPHALGDLTGALATSGSDLATGLLEQTGEPEPWLLRAQADAHREPLTSGPVPAALAGDLTLANKALTRNLARRLELGSHDDWLCSPALARLLPGLTVDVLDRPVARYAWGRGHRAFGARPDPLPELDAWLRISDDVCAAVEGTPLEDGWRRHWYDVLLPRFVADAERADDATWRRLVELSPVPDGVGLRVSSRSLLSLAAAGRRTEVQALAAELDSLGDDVPTELTSEGPVAVWGSVHLSAEDRRLGDEETRMRVLVVRVAETDAGRDVDLWVRIAGVDLAAHPLELTVDADGTEVSVHRRPDRNADRWAGTRFQSAAEGAARVTVPAGTRRLRVVARVHGLVRSACVVLPPRTADGEGRGPVVQEITLDGELVVVRLDRPVEGLRLRGPGTDVPGELRPDGTVAFSTRRDLYGRQVWLPTAVYRLHRPAGLGAATAWRERLPVEAVGERHRMRVLAGGGGPGEIHLGPPRADDELGAYGQERLRAAYLVDDRETDPGQWYFESFAGRSATDTPLALFEELRRRRPDLEPAWGIVDHGHWVPSGARPVVIGSREWYGVLGTARVLVTNTEPEAWYRRRPDQLVVQCFHGYPSKAMGLSQWEARELPPRRIAVMRRRSVESWDLISTPTPEMTEVYREQYGYAGPAAEHGYPRNDMLRGPDGDAVRDRARRLLGVRPDQTAVLHAPTWRDHLATRPRAAAMSEHLDVDAAAAALGDSHVLLLRGHRFHTPGRSRRGVVDVTEHPEVNELILASDVAVLDYSSIRFDYALTGRPMVFLVPDLADYTSGVRGFLFPFEDTAPGPLVSTTEEVVAQVRDVAALSAAWSEQVRAFDARFNPHEDGHAAARMLDSVLALLNADPALADAHRR
ncbi:MAG TPA: CDP-glycerol glycerophosphotransferase family protein [Nocardioides sp.]|uniref:bifunctional glycosyltransferase/CDP-glycerol:glycerophosphate glycerophosphotransferase n=1 Tax=Nocardioides sp. TaxID=35761 RepID=UPI002F42544F